jgi:alanyl-tRNA synthetase
MIAVTGQDAYDVQRKAKEFSEQLDRLDQMPLGPEKEDLAKHIKVELDKTSISAIVKTEFRTKCDNIGKKIIAAQVSLLSPEPRMS